MATITIADLRKLLEEYDEQTSFDEVLRASAPNPLFKQVYEAFINVYGHPNRTLAGNQTQLSTDSRGRTSKQRRDETQKRYQVNLSVLTDMKTADPSKELVDIIETAKKDVAAFWASAAETSPWETDATFGKAFTADEHNNTKQLLGTIRRRLFRLFFFRAACSLGGDSKPNTLGRTRLFHAIRASAQAETQPTLEKVQELVQQGARYERLRRKILEGSPNIDDHGIVLLLPQVEHKVCVMPEC